MLHRVIHWTTEKLSALLKFAHLACIAMIVASLLHEGGGHADWGFVMLAFLCEVPRG